MAMNTVSANTSSMASLATSVLGNAREAFKAIAEAATNSQVGGPAAAGPSAAGKGARRGTILDRYL
ncbi:hypothetical protein [Actinoplanes siamensis]|uniref:hypothetical protein n=1 Tax=Actinoplanes siamensis TaxID=1223317 RepID=UPI00361718D9